MVMISQLRTPYRKRIRLSLEAYRQLGAICSITVALRERRPVFLDQLVAEGAVDVLDQLATRTGTPVYAYCLMPDHVHLLIGPSPSCDIIDFVGQFKNLVQRLAWRHGIQGRIWQTSFWDHFLRVDEDIPRAANYILNNPVRRGLVTRWEEYSHSGSFVFPVRPGSGGQAPALRSAT